MPGGFVPYHHSTGKKYKTKSTTSSVTSGVTSVAQGVSKGGSKVYGGSPSSYGYVPPSSSSGSSAAAARAVAEAKAAVKAAKAVVSEYGKSTKNPKSVSGKYAKASEKAKKKREKSKRAVEKKTAEVSKKYETKRGTIGVGSKSSPKKITSALTAGKVEKKDPLREAKNPIKGPASQVGFTTSIAGSGARTVAKASTRRQQRVGSLWRDAKKVSGLQGPAPRVVSTDDSAPYVYDGRKKVHLPLEKWDALGGNARAYNKNSDLQGVLLHEFAHTSQRKNLRGDKAEGSAERYRQKTSKALGIPTTTVSSNAYRSLKQDSPSAPKKVMYGQFSGRAKGAPGSKVQRFDDPGRTPEFGPGNAYKIWEGANRIAAKAKELSKGKTGKAETEATRNAARAAAALSRAVTVTKPEGPTPKKIKRVASNYQRAVEKATTIDAPLSTDQKTFAAALARATGLSPRLAAAAVLREGGNNTDGDNNWLNIGWFDSGPDPVITTDPRWRDPATAAQLTADFLAGKEFGASEGIQNIYRVAQAGGSDEEIGRAWANSGWASSGASPLDTLDQIGTARSEPIPKNLRHRAKATLGKDVMEALRQGGKIVKDPNAGEKTKGAIPYKETKKYIVPTEARSEISAEQRAPARTMVTGMDPALQAALVQLAKNTGIPVRINEGYRTEARANDFPSGTASQHHQGNAADIDNNADYSAEDLAKVGLNNTAVGGEPWHFQLNNPDATASTVNTNIPIKGTNLAVKVPTPTSTSGATGTTTSGGTSSTGAPVPGTPEYQQMMNEVRRRRGPSVAKRLAAIDRWMTSPVTAPTPEISQELIDRILGK